MARLTLSFPCVFAAASISVAAQLKTPADWQWRLDTPAPLVTVATIPRTDVGTEGRVGFRIGAGVNLHISSLDVTTRLAPVPPPKKTQ